MIQKIFQLRVCDDTVFKNRERPCILYQIKRCSGPCVGFVKEHDYRKSVEDAIKFVSGKSRKFKKVYLIKWRLQVKSWISKERQF